jgi:DNA-3-methyladenine glycosylase II
LITFELRPVPPFRLDLTVWALKRRADYGVEGWDGTTYRRVLLDGEQPFSLSVEQVGTAGDPVLLVQASTDSDTEVVNDREKLASEACVLLLGTEIDLAAFYGTADDSPELAPLVDRLRGMKPPRYLSLFETLANAITCQLITLTVGLRILDRFATRYGVPLPESTDNEGPSRAFPRVQDIELVEADALRDAGYSRQKARALTEIAVLADDAVLNAASYADEDDDSAIDRLRALHGVGRWTAEYALLRGLGRLNVFPGDDVGVRRHLERWLDLPDRLDHAGVQRTLAPWAPFAGLIYLHLVVNGIVESGLVTS